MINCFKEKKLAFHLIGYGGFPSTHSSIVSSSVSLIYFETRGLRTTLLETIEGAQGAAVVAAKARHH